VPKAMNNPFFDLARDGCYKAQEELADVTCEYIGPGEHTEMEQIQIVQDLISKGVDGIAVAPSNAPAMAKALKAAQEAGIPVMTWDSDLLPEDAGLRTTYVGTFNYDIGVNLAKLVMARHPDGGTICLQTGGAVLGQSGSFLAATTDIEVDTSWGGAKSFFSGEGLILLRCSGHGLLFLSSYGAIHLKELNAGEEYTVDTGHMVAFDESVRYTVGRSGGWKTTLLSGEGLVCKLEGPGRFYMQTRSQDAFLSWLLPKIPKQ